MSGPALKWARLQNVHSAVLKSVVNVIAARVGPQGTTFVSQATLAADAGMGERTIRRHLALLEALGVITRQVRSKGRQGRLSDVITLSLHRSFDLSAVDLRAARALLAEKQKQRPTESSNRPLCVVPTGQQWPGNSKGTTYPSQEEELTYQGRALATAGGWPRLVVVPRGSLAGEDAA